MDQSVSSVERASGTWSRSYDMADTVSKIREGALKRCISTSFYQGAVWWRRKLKKVLARDAIFRVIEPRAASFRRSQLRRGLVPDRQRHKRPASEFDL